MTIPLKRRTDGLGEFQSGDAISIEHGGTGATNIGDVQDILGISDKLDAADYVQHFKGVFTSYSALTTAIPIASDGDYAHIDSGSGFDRMAAIWDTSDLVWIVQDTNVGANTDEIPEGSTNLYFTSARVRSVVLTGLSIVNSAITAADTILDGLGKAQGQINNIVSTLAANVRSTVLTGLSTATGGTITSSDTVLSALGKLQNQISSSGSGSPTWVDIATVGTVQSYVTPINVQVSKFQGMLWIRGTFNVNTTVAVNSELFRITAQAYKPYSYSTAGSARLLQVVNAWNLSATAAKQLGFSALGNITNSSQASSTDVIFEIKAAGISTADGTINIPPTIIGTLAV